MAVTLRTLLFGLALIGLFTTIAISYTHNMMDSYSVTMDTEYEDVFTEMNKTSQYMSETSGNFSDASKKITEGSILGGAISGATGVVQILLLPFNAIDNIMTMATKVAVMIGIPAYVTSIFETMLILTIVLIIIAAVLRYKYV